MKIILLKDIPKIGHKNEVKDVADGYALNFVIPRGLGVKATPAEVAKLEKNKAVIDAERKVQEELLAKRIDSLGAITVTITEKANDKGHLFEGIGTSRLAQEIEKAAGIALEPGFITLPKPLKSVGEFIVAVEAHGKKGKVKVVIETK